MGYVYLILLARNMVAKVLVLVEAASQMTIAAVLLVRAKGEHHNATSAETAMLFENNNMSHYPRAVAMRFAPEDCSVSCEWTETLTSLGITPDPTVGPAHHQVMWNELSKL